jgi:phage terminase large subunit-like protein
MDDLIKSDEDAASEAIMNKIKNSIYKGIVPALDPKRRKIILNGTPFNKSDIMCEAVESGSWHVNVWPVCEQWPCSEAEFRSSWPDRFTYDAVKKASDLTKGAFDQEMMLRLTSAEERLVMDHEIKKYSYKDWMATRPAYTVYTTTDFATTEQKKNDFNVVSDWAVDHEGNFRFIGGYCKRQLMDKTVDQIFESAEKYPAALMGVGCEVTGQQGGFISWIIKEMTNRSLFFNLLSHGNGNKPGIRVISSKLQRMNEVVPLIKAGKIMVPDDMEDHPWMIEFWNEIKLATKKGLKSKHDDVLDTVSMLYLITPILPAQPFSIPEDSEMDNREEDQYALANYLA